MNVLDSETLTVMTDEAGRVVGYESHPATPERPRSRGRLLLAGGFLGLVGAGFICLAPELGIASAVGGVLAGVGSAGMTLLARK
jgi:hypothetical protein